MSKNLISALFPLKPVVGINALFLMLSLNACASSASLVRKDQVGGRVELKGAYMPAMADARLLMVEHCQGRFVAIERGNHVEFECKAHAAAAHELIARAE